MHGLALCGARDAAFPDVTVSDGLLLGGLAGGDDGNGLSDEARERIAYVAAGLSYHAEERDVVVGQKTRLACVFLPEISETPATEPWIAEAWSEQWGRIAINVATEVAQHFGTIEADRLRQMMPMILVRASARAAANPSAPTAVRSDTPADRVTVHEAHNRHAGFFLTREFTLQHPKFDGSDSARVKREVFVATDAAIVLPYDPVRDRVLLVEQFRMGPFGRGDPRPWMLEPVAGRVDPGEDPMETARRECEEEAGLTLNRIEHISSHYCSPGCSTEYFHCFLGLCDLPDTAGGQGGLETEHEDIRSHILSFDAAMALIPSGEAANGPLVLSLLWLSMARERLRAGV